VPLAGPKNERSGPEKGSRAARPVSGLWGRDSGQAGLLTRAFSRQRSASLRSLRAAADAPIVSLLHDSRFDRRRAKKGAIMKSEIIVAEFGSRREIGRWSVLPYPFVRRIQHPEIAKAGTNLIIVRKIIPRALTVRVELSVQLPPLYEGRLVERRIVQMEPNSVCGYARVQGNDLWFPPISLDPSGKGVLEWSSTLSIMKLIFAMGLNTPKYGQMRSL